MVHTLTIADNRSADVPTLELRGSLDLHTHHALRAELEQLIEAGHRHLRLDLSEVDYLGSVGLAVLIQANQRLRARGGQLQLIPGRQRRHLELMQLHLVFDLQ